MNKTNIHDFMGELDAGIFEQKMAAALSDVALGVVNHNKEGKVTLEFKVKKMDSDNPQVQISHKLTYAKPTKRGKSSEEDTTATPMYVHKGGKLSVTPEKVDNALYQRDSENPTVVYKVN
ncbi:hypothetical protein QJU23_01140 [Pasteurella atlantica]|uniref:Uncharacterized protein n=2 Tax=Pasteurellaceae TaxID=712 RepID=A0ACC6HK60_9PAST|nr:hypothetical protein [Pasteurella atlantica]MDP8051026.1 hypothetical protein [Pasteurella atlantica]MDP8104322.1 hypothetical protein [Pasteurella atlantica]MDP8147682.1 hypothetical protein [Pasteurella atlantica]